MNIKLTESEQFFAALSGLMRRFKAIRKNRSEPLGTPAADLWGNDIESSGAEMAVAKHFNLHWSGAVHKNFTLLGGDVGNCLEVRSTHWPNGKLRIDEKDKDERPFVLVRGTMPTFSLSGWCFAYEAKEEKYKEPGDGRFKDPADWSYWVPAQDLRPMESLVIVEKNAEQ